ncbi:MAG: EAL domain-containing protein [Mycobacteriales bacterium]
MSRSQIARRGAGRGPGVAAESVRAVLEAARTHLGMDMAFLGEFVGDREVYQTVAGDGASFGLTEGSALPLADTYCQAMVEGRIDNVVRDAQSEPTTAALAATTAGRIGRYVGVPVHLPDGRLYGALCGLGHGPDASLGPRDAGVMTFLATVVGAELGRESAAAARAEALAARVRPLLAGNGLEMVFQPIVALADGATVGVESLARFGAQPVRSPDVWFAEAAEVGLGLELELSAVRAALGALGQLPTGVYLSLNVSAETACSVELAAALGALDCSRLVLEITEHAAVANYAELTAALAPLRAAGVRLAVDDAGAGVASLHHILELAPELIKMDISLTRGIDTSPARAALATALVAFAAQTGSAILAEGVETAAELQALGRLGVSYGQGYLLGRPGPLPTPGPARRWRAVEPRRSSSPASRSGKRTGAARG